MEELEYLQPGFDPSQLTMPRLRNILMTHDITYPSSAKKNDLVEIFTTQLKPKSRKLLASRDRVRRTSEGITNMPSRSDVSSVEEDDNSSMPPPSVPATPRQRKSKKTSRSSVGEILEEPAPLTVTKSTGIKSASRQSRQSDTETDADTKPVVPKSRKSEVTPKPKPMPAQQPATRPLLPESAFSDDNPFQSGSSPPTEEPTRRKSAGVTSEKKKASSTRRRTDGSLGGSSSSRSVQIPVSSLKAPEIEEQDGLEPGEEFTPEEQNALSTDVHASESRTALARQSKPRSASKISRSTPWVVSSSLLLGYATWYRQEKLAVGYCGLGRPSDIQLPVQVPEWADFLQPTCDPCPQHARCFENFQMRCDPDFVLRPHPLSLGGIVPVAATCEPDGDKARKVKVVADRAVETLRKRKAAAECGTASDPAGTVPPAEMSERELKKEVSRNKKRGMADEEFEDLWKGAIGEIAGRDEVETSPDG